MPTSTNEQNNKNDTRFGFGKNWQQFSQHITEERIAEAERSLREMLSCATLQGKSFLDIGSGSGLFSLAASRLGARVVSFDYDAHSVACTEKLRQRFKPDTANWTIRQGSVLDADFIKTLGSFDVVYSWGVLHHTGSMWQALDNVLCAGKENGQVFIALYNDQGLRSKIWKVIKWLYCSSMPGRAVVTALCLPALSAASAVLDLSKGRNPLARYRDYARKNRGMTVYHDWLDWLGGYPFEVAAPKQIIAFYEEKGLSLQKLKQTNGWGNNEFVFTITDKPAMT